MKLLLDIGNTRVKWAMLEKGVPGAACARERTGDDAALLGEIAAGLPAPESVFICSVAGTRADEAAGTRYVGGNMAMIPANGQFDSQFPIALRPPAPTDPPVLSVTPLLGLLGLDRARVLR